MSNECKDRDLLAIEPSLFAGGGFQSQQLAAGTDGGLAGTTFTSAAADFGAAGVVAGMVLCVYTTAPAEARSCEVLSVDSDTSMTVSALRANADGAAIAPQPGSDLKYYVQTFQPQIASAEAALAEKLRQVSEAEGIAPSDFADSSQFGQAVALGALAAVFVARAANASDTDPHWIKAEFYRRRHVAAVAAIRLASDVNGDGVAERTRTLGNVTLRRA